MTDTIHLIESADPQEITVDASQPINVQESLESIAIQEVSAQAIEVTIDEIGQPIGVQITGDVGVVARLANLVVTAEANSAQSAFEAANSATAASQSATAAAGSASAAATSEQNALQSATTANQHRIDAGISADAAATSEGNAAGSAASAAGSATSAQTYASNSQISADNSEQSALDAADSATAADGAAGSAATSATNAANSATAAAGSASSASASASTATTQAGISTTQAGLADDARVAAEAAESNAAGSATAASGSATAAAGSASSAQTALSGAEAAELLAQQWANHPQDTLVPGQTEYSAKHYALEAADSAASASGQVVFLGSWDAAANGTPPTPANSARYIVISDGVVDGKNVYVNDFITYSVPDAEWFVTPGSGNVSSVNGQIGAVDLDYGDFAGATNASFDAGVGITSGGGYLLRKNSGNTQVWVGNTQTGLAINSPTVPEWNDGAVYRDLLHTGGGQTIAGTTTIGSKLHIVGEIDAGSGAALQVDGFMRTGNIYLHEGGNTPIGATAKVLGNTAGNLVWDGNKVITAAGGYTIAGDNTLTGRLIIAPTVAGQDIMRIDHTVSGNMTVDLQDDYLRFRGSGDDTIQGIRLDDFDVPVVELNRHTSSNFALGLNAASISEGGTALSAKYLGINATAANSASLGNIAYERFIYGKNAQGTKGVDALGVDGWNDVLASGFYNGNAQLNDPSGSATGWYWGLHCSHENGNHYGWSMVSSNSNEPSWYLRGVTSGNWGAWHRVLHEDINPTLTGSWLFEQQVKSELSFRAQKTGSGAGFVQTLAGHGGYYLGAWNTGNDGFRLEQTTDAGGWEKAWIQAERNGSVRLYDNGSQKFQTTATGGTLSGELIVTGNVTPAGVDLTGGGYVNLPNATGITVRDNPGTGNYDALRMRADNILAIGYDTAPFPLRLCSQNAPVWWDGTNSRNILTSASGQVISGNLTLQSGSPGLYLVETDIANPGDNHRLIASGGQLYLQSEGDINLTGYNGVDVTGAFVQTAGGKRQILTVSGGESIEYLKFGPGTAANDDAHIEWLGGNNDGYLRISTADDNGQERVELGDYDTTGRGGAFTRWIDFQRDLFNFWGTGTAKMWRMTDQGGFALECDSSMLLFAGDTGSKVATGLGIDAAYGSENMILAADSNVYLCPGQQSGYTTAGRITVTSSMFTFGAKFTVNSDRNKKHKIRRNPYKPAELLKKLQRVDWIMYDWKPEFGVEKDAYGVIAQEIQKVLPEVVHMGADGYLTVDYQRIANYWSMVNGWLSKKHEREIGDLFRRVERLEAA